MVAGTRADAEALWPELGGVLGPMGLSLSVEKSGICHIDEGFDFLGFRIQRRSWHGRPGKRAIYTYPSKRSLAAVIGKARMLTRRARHRTLADLLRAINPVLRGWCSYFRHGASKRVFCYLDHFTWWRIVSWLRKRHLGLNWGTISRRYLPGWESATDVSRCSGHKRKRSAATATGATSSPHHGTETHGVISWRAGCAERCTSGSEGGPGKRTGRKAGTAPRSDPYTEHPTREGKVYCCAIKDVYSNRIVGYSLDGRMTASLAVSALRNAIGLRQPEGTIVVHSDRGSQFRSKAFVRTLKHNGLVGSMGRVGACGDNAAMESFFSLLQKNVLDRQRWESRDELRLAIVTWIERTYHRRRRQRALGRLTPVEFELLEPDLQAA